MIEVAVTSIQPVPDEEIRLMDGRTKEQVWLVPVEYHLADGFMVRYFRKVHGNIENARAYRNALPMVPTYPTRCVFNEDNELVNVVTRMVPVAVEV